MKDKKKATHNICIHIISTYYIIFITENDYSFIYSIYIYPHPLFIFKKKIERKKDREKFFLIQSERRKGGGAGGGFQGRK